MRLLLHGSAALAVTAVAKPQTPSPPPPPPRTRGQSLAEPSIAKAPRATCATPQTPVPVTRITESAVDGFLVEAVKKGLHGEVMNGEGMLWRLVEVLKGVDGRRVLPLEEIADGHWVSLLRKECGRLLAGGDVKELVAEVEALAGLGFPVGDLVKPADVIKELIVGGGGAAALLGARIRHAVTERNGLTGTLRVYNFNAHLFT